MPFLNDVYLPIPTKDIISWCCDDPAFDHDKTIYVDVDDPSRSISANQTKSLIRRLVAGFKEAGLRRGDCVCVHSFNNLYYPILVLGIIAAGGVFTGTNPSNTTFELKHYLKTAQARFIISEADILNPISAAAKELSIPQSHILVLDNNGQHDHNGFRSWRTLLEHGEEDWVRFDHLETSKNTNAMLLFSSGTTGLSKAVQLSHYNLVAQHIQLFAYKPRPYDVSRITPLPMFHAAVAPTTPISPLKFGHVCYIMRRFETFVYLRNVETFQITDLVMVPPMVIAVVQAMESGKAPKSSLASVHHAYIGAAPLDTAMQNRLQALARPDAALAQIWGATEVSGFGSVFYYPESDNTGSVGRWMPGIDVKLVDDDGTELEKLYDTRGELCVRGPNVTRGYLNNPEANGRDWDEDGYFHTGDVVYCDSKTKLWYIVDRKKELIKVRGFQVAPNELEGVLLSHPDIIDVAVVGVSLPNSGSELPRAYVVRRQGAKVSEEEVKRHLNERLAKYKSLEGGVKFVDTIPKTPSGKILKRLLRDQALKEMSAKL